MTLQIKDKKLFGRFYIVKNLNYRGLLVDKGSGSGSGSGIFLDLDLDPPGDPKRPDPDLDPHHWLKLCSRFIITIYNYFTGKLSEFYFTEGS